MQRFPMGKALLILAAFLLLMTMMDQTSGPSTPGISATGPSVQVPYSTVKDEIKNDGVLRAVMTESRIVLQLSTPRKFGETNTETAKIYADLPPVQDPGLLPLLEERNIEIITDRAEQSSTLWVLFVNILPIAILIGFWVWTARCARSASQMGPFGNFAQSKAKMFDESRPKVTFNDVAGMKEQKRELEELVDFLKTPEKYEKIGGRVPRGVLLMGPPGTGKTLLAKAVAGEAGVPFFSISASEFIEMFVGVGASRVRDLFKNAREKAPAIIFIDEIDAVGRSRGAGLGGGHDEREQTLNQLLGEMDGFEAHEQIIVIAATNRPDVLDSALLRPGRFDRQVMIDMPTLSDREAILRVHTKRLPLAPDVDLAKVARGTPGMSGADLENLCNEAALFAARLSDNQVEMKHFDEAKDKILMGVEREHFTSEEEQRITAYHESGHTLVARKIPGMDPVHKVTILPRGPALGLTQLIPERDRYYRPKKWLTGQLAVMIGGRAAEIVVFDDTSTGAGNDLKRATELAEKMVCQWGMSDKIGPVTFGRGEEHVFLGKKIAQDKTWSEQMGWIIDQEVEKVLRDAEDQALLLLREHRTALDRLAEALLEREELSGEEVDLILADKPLPPKEKTEEEFPTPSAAAPAPTPADGEQSTTEDESAT